MKGSDEAAKAIYRGREGMGVMISVLGMGLGTQGLITEQGPRDPQKRKLWEEAGNQAALHQHSVISGYLPASLVLWASSLVPMPIWAWLLLMLGPMTSSMTCVTS